MPSKAKQGATKQRGGGGVLLVPGLDLRAGQIVAGKYRVEELLGSGASGVVLSARNVHLQERVALKILASYTDGQEELQERRLAKARLAARLSSSHVARIVDIGLTEEAMPYVATEWLDGRTLEHELAERRRVDVEQAVRWVLEACEGVAEAHAAGLVHGDLKPQNIFVATSRTGAPTIKLLDFGTTSPLDAIGDQSASAFFGSPAFVAPEQIQNPGAVDHRADVWALGVILYNLISGSLPFEADTVSGVIVAVVYDAPAMLTDAPYELARLVQHCLEKDAANRFQNVTELATALAPFAGTAGVRLSDRVHAMLDAAPLTHRHRAARRDALDETATSGSVSPVSVSLAPEAARAAGDPRESHEPLLLVKKRATARGAVERKTRAASPVAALAPQEQTALPSKAVAARKRRSRSRIAAYGFVAAASVLALAGWAAREDVRMVPALLANAAQGSAALALEGEVPEARDRSTIVEVPAYVPRAAVVPSATPVAELPAAQPDPSAAAAPAAPASQPAPAAPEAPVSFAATSPAGVTPTPLAVSPTPLAAEPLPPRAPAAHAPASPFAAPPPRTTTPGALPNAPTAAPSPAPKLMTPATLPNAPPASKQTMPPARTAPALPAPNARMLNAPPTPLPPPRSTPAARAGLDNTPRSATPSRLPAGLPTSRDALPPYGATPATPATPAPRTSKAANRSDESYLRKLLTDRK